MLLRAGSLWIIVPGNNAPYIGADDPVFVSESDAANERDRMNATNAHLRRDWTIMSLPDAFSASVCEAASGATDEG
jgi:hypothetical protein